MTHLDKLSQKHSSVSTEMLCTNDEEKYLLLSDKQRHLERLIAREENRLAREYSSHNHYPKPILVVLLGLVLTLILLFVFGNP